MNEKSMHDDTDTSELKEDDLYTRLKGQYCTDLEALKDWRDKAELWYNFRNGKQYTDREEEDLQASMRPAIALNRIGPIIDTVVGQELQNRTETKYFARGHGDVRVSELMTSAGAWFDDVSMAEDAQSDAFCDLLICGMGWVETRLDYGSNPLGDPFEERVSPFEMVWDSGACRPNLTDARRVFRVKVMSPEAAKELFPKAEREDLHAAWAETGAEPENVDNGPGTRYRDATEEDTRQDRQCYIVHAQWVEREQYEYISIDGGGTVEVNDENREMYAGYPTEKASRPVWMQAFLGRKMLSEPMRTLCGKPHFRALTGKRDEIGRYWYGLVRPMVDPQMWQNKWLVQALHILNSTAKGGIIAESDAFADPQQASMEYAKPHAITWAAPGALAQNKIIPKPGQGMPAGIMELMQFAVASVPDVSGISLEMQGLARRDQPGILEYQRRQAAMTVMAGYMNALRRFRKDRGRFVMSLILDYLSDGRLVRVIGGDSKQYIPLLREPGVSEYDLVVDEAPSAPSQREATWQSIQPMLPIVGPMMSPDMWVDIIEYGPFPASFVDKMRDKIKNAGEQIPPEVQKAQAQIAAEREKLAAMQQIEAEKAKLANEAKLQEIQLQHAADLRRIELEEQRAIREMRMKAELKQMELRMEADLELLRIESGDPQGNGNIPESQ